MDLVERPSPPAKSSGFVGSAGPGLACLGGAWLGSATSQRATAAGYGIGESGRFFSQPKTFRAFPEGVWEPTNRGPGGLREASGSYFGASRGHFGGLPGSEDFHRSPPEIGDLWENAGPGGLPGSCPGKP